MKPTAFLVLLTLGFSLASRVYSETVETPKTIVPGNLAGWTKITGVEKQTLIKVNAIGVVDFGCRFGACKDGPDAGVEGNGFAMWIERLGGKRSDWESALANPSTYPDRVKQVFATAGPVNFSRGGVWIKIVRRSDGSALIPISLWYYWKNGYNQVGIMSDSDVDVFAKAHDGGVSPDATGSYDDNTGYYTLWLTLEKPERVKWTLP